jgi:hypothetical protein
MPFIRPAPATHLVQRKKDMGSGNLFDIRKFKNSNRFEEKFEPDQLMEIDSSKKPIFSHICSTDNPGWQPCQWPLYLI